MAKYKAATGIYDDGGAHDGALVVLAEDCAVDGARRLKVGEPYKSSKIYGGEA